MQVLAFEPLRLYKSILFYMKMLHQLSIILLIVGGLNWALYAFNFNLVHAIFGFAPFIEKLVYILVGVAAVYKLLCLTKVCGNGTCTTDKK